MRANGCLVAGSPVDTSLARQVALFPLTREVCSLCQGDAQTHARGISCFPLTLLIMDVPGITQIDAESAEEGAEDAEQSYSAARFAPS